MLDNSALDNATEKAAIDRLDAHLVLMIAHRLSTLERCDTVIDFSQGKIVGEKTC